MSEDMLNVMGSFISTELDAFENLHKELEEKDKEIERLNNIINEIEKRCKEMLKLYNTFNDEQKFNNWKEYKVYGTILDWIEELKGEDKE